MIFLLYCRSIILWCFDLFCFDLFERRFFCYQHYWCSSGDVQKWPRSFFSGVARAMFKNDRGHFFSGVASAMFKNDRDHFSLAQLLRCLKMTAVILSYCFYFIILLYCALFCLELLSEGFSATSIVLICCFLLLYYVVLSGFKPKP